MEAHGLIKREHRRGVDFRNLECGSHWSQTDRRLLSSVFPVCSPAAPPASLTPLLSIWTCRRFTAEQGIHENTARAPWFRGLSASVASVILSGPRAVVGE